MSRRIVRQLLAVIDDLTVERDHLKRDRDSLITILFEEVTGGRDLETHDGAA